MFSVVGLLFRKIGENGLFIKFKPQICKFATAPVTNEKPSQKEANFGYEKVSEEEKTKKVYQVFENVASNYDLMNDVMSLRIHRYWKDQFVEKLGPTLCTQLIDVAGGTGDIAFRFLKTVNQLDHQHKTEFSLSSDYTRDKIKRTAHVTVVDINEPMLDVGRQRSLKEPGAIKGSTWMQGDAENLPLEENKFDAYTIAFGIRNCTHIDKVLTEAYRVLKPGGRFMCLEFSHVTNPLLSNIYDAYSFNVIPVMGYLIARDWHSYKYLVESIRVFPKQEEFADMIRNAGFQCVSYENMTFGTVAIHSGFKL